MNFRQAWCKETAHPSYQKEWNENNPTYGQCLPTALIVQDTFGGDIYSCKIKNKIHFYNIIDERIVDLTKEQFQSYENEPLFYEGTQKKDRNKLLKVKHVYERYKLLKQRLLTN